MTNEELMQVLKEISDDCHYRTNCSGCKFYIGPLQCALDGKPDEWNIEEE